MKILVTVPCYNAERTILACLSSLLAGIENVKPEHDVRVLLVDDLSTDQTSRLIQEFISSQPCFSGWSYVRVSEKAYSGGARNYGITKALDDHFDMLICCDSDCLINPLLVKQYVSFFQTHPQDPVTAAAYIPAGNFWQIVDTLLNASKFLYENTNAVRYHSNLSSANFAINIRRFREKPIFFQKIFDGDDWLFFNELKETFGMTGLAFLPYAGFKHLSSTNSFARCVQSSKRYANAYCHKFSCGQISRFDKYPHLHYSLPRFWLILARMFQAGYFHYVYCLPVLLWLDLLRSRHVVKKIRESRHD
ncbi:MAG: glycosyltransferase family 2 protein [Phycisphaerae bacterium]